MVADDPELELRLIGEEIGTHEPGADRIAAGDSLDSGFGPVAPNFGLLSNREAPAVQHGEVGWVLIGRTCHEGGHGGHGRVVMPYPAQRVDVHALAVGPGTVEEEHHMRGGDAAEAVAGRPLEVLLQLGISASDLIEE